MVCKTEPKTEPGTPQSSGFLAMIQASLRMVNMTIPQLSTDDLAIVKREISETASLVEHELVYTTLQNLQLQGTYICSSR